MYLIVQRSGFSMFARRLHSLRTGTDVSVNKLFDNLFDKLCDERFR